MCVDIISHACTNMDGGGSSPKSYISLETSDISLETSPPPQDVTQEPDPRLPNDSSDDPASIPGRSADIPPEPSRSAARERSYYNGLALQLAQERAIHHWLRPRHPEYATLARRLRSFDKWSAEGKPSPESIATAGFYYDGVSKF